MDHNRTKLNLAVITVYNDKMLFNQMKSSVYTRGGGRIEYCSVYGIDNTYGKFSSAAQAYNYAIDTISDVDCFVFCHQDILFLEGSIETIIKTCLAHPDALYGAAGVKNIGHDGGNERIISSISQVGEGNRSTTLAPGSECDVFTLDECLICGCRAVFEQFRFNEQICSGWHLYAVELSMHCLTENIPVRVFDANIVHLSGGTQDRSFYDCEAKLIKKYRKHFQLISYTCGWAYTDPVRYSFLRLYRKLRYHMG